MTTLTAGLLAGEEGFDGDNFATANAPDSEPMTPVFRCRNVYIDFGAGPNRKRVLEDFNFDVHEGEFVTIVGGSGVGKTTVLRILGGLLPAGRGCEVTYRGTP